MIAPVFFQQNHVCFANRERIADGQLQQRPEQPPRSGQGRAAAVQCQQRDHLARHRTAPAQGLHTGSAGVLQCPPVSGRNGEALSHTRSLRTRV